MMVNRMDAYAKTLNQQKILQNMQKQQPTENQNITKTET